MAARSSDAIHLNLPSPYARDSDSGASDDEYDETCDYSAHVFSPRGANNIEELLQANPFDSSSESGDDFNDSSLLEGSMDYLPENPLPGYASECRQEFPPPPPCVALPLTAYLRRI